MRLKRPIQTRFRYGCPTRVNLATYRKLAGSFFKRHAVTLVRRPWGLQRLVCTRFQALFHSPPGVLFTFPSRYLSAIGHQGVFRLSGWSRQIHTGFLGPRATWDVANECSTFRLRGSYPLCRPFRMAFDYDKHFLLAASPPELTKQSHNPTTATTGVYHAAMVWPLPRSLATTNGITFVFSSCGY